MYRWSQYRFCAIARAEDIRSMCYPQHVDTKVQYHYSTQVAQNRIISLFTVGLLIPAGEHRRASLQAPSASSVKRCLPRLRSQLPCQARISPTRSASAGTPSVRCVPMLHDYADTHHSGRRARERGHRRRGVAEAQGPQVIRAVACWLNVLRLSVSGNLGGSAAV
jgi:hypothetical protein